MRVFSSVCQPPSNLLGGMTAVVAPVAARCHHAMWDEEPGRQGASAIVSEGASEESSASSAWLGSRVGCTRLSAAFAPTTARTTHDGTLSASVTSHRLVSSAAS